MDTSHSNLAKAAHRSTPQTHKRVCAARQVQPWISPASIAQSLHRERLPRLETIGHATVLVNWDNVLQVNQVINPAAKMLITFTNKLRKI